jgi:ribosomal protein S18 acetylase RimI-like enzyme
MNVAAQVSNRGARPLGEGDLDRIVSIDRAYTGHSRRRFFEKRLASAKAHPADFVQIGLMRGGSLRGFILAHVQRGEFGLAQDVGVFDAVGVEPECQERGVGQDLVEELVDIMRRKGVRSLRSQANWTNHDLLRFLDASGFVLSQRLFLERPVAEPLTEETDNV